MKQINPFHAGLLVLAATLASAPALAADTPGELPPGVVARQGGVEVTLDDIDAAAHRIPEKDRAGFFDSPKRIESTIMGLLLQRQLAAEARAGKLDQDADVQRQIRLATDDTLARIALEHHRATLKLPDFEPMAREYYTSHKDEFLVPGAIKVQHVLVSTKDRSLSEAKARIGEVEAAARAHPEQFDALVEKYSDDPSKDKNGGVIDNAGSGKMVAQFSAAAKALKSPGEISGVARTEYGFHVLKLIERKPDTQRSFADVHDELIRKLRSNYIDTQMTQYSGEMRGKELQANPDLVASLRTRYLPPGAVMPAEAEKAAGENAATKQDDGGNPSH